MVETETNYYATANEEAKKHIDPEILNNPIVFVPQEHQDSGLEPAQDVSLDENRQRIWRSSSRASAADSIRSRAR